MRHTFASRLLRRGADIVAVKELLCHSTIVVTRRATRTRAKKPKCVRFRPWDVVANQLQSCLSRVERGSDSAVKRMKSGRIGIGGMGEWLKPAVLKTVSGVTRSGVRIPLPPPFISFVMCILLTTF
jgi:hypothetical protein